MYLVSVLTTGYESRLGKKTLSSNFHEEWLSKTLFAQASSKNSGIFTIIFTVIYAYR